jgi:hypothetical protein
MSPPGDFPERLSSNPFGRRAVGSLGAMGHSGSLGSGPESSGIWPQGLCWPCRQGGYFVGDTGVDGAGDFVEAGEL